MYYDVFKAGTNGGKRLRVLEHLPESVMPEIARESKAPMTAFLESDTKVRFFTKSGQEKLESDSGALVVAHHLGRSCTIQMRASDLNVLLEDDYAWANQPDTHILPLNGTESEWLAALNIEQLEDGLTMLCAGTLEKHNLIVPVKEHWLEKMPNFIALAKLLAQHRLNGCIVAALNSSRANLEYRFFAPHKGLQEDNAGSFSLASLCGYLAAHTPSGIYDRIAAQGYKMGKPSELRARFVARDSTALAVRVGGRVVLAA
ncbi:MAG: PhzF family phenazine biosynthesis protein [Deinococcales bacterium]